MSGWSGHPVLQELSLSLSWID